MAELGQILAHLTGADPEVPAAPADATLRDLDAQVQTALQHFPGNVPLFVGWDPDAPLMYVNTGARTDTPPAQMQTVLDRWANRRQIVPPELIGRVAPTRLEGINLRGVFRFPVDRYAAQILPSQTARKTSASA